MIADIFLKLNWSAWIFAIVLGLIGVGAYLYYFRTLPPLSSWRRIPLLTFRALVLSIVLFLILEPVLNVVREQYEKPAIAVLLDNSASMEIRDPYGTRGDSLRFVQRYLTPENFRDSLDIYPFLFDITMRPLTRDTLSFDVDGTNISQALNGVLDSLSGKNLQAIVLVSDGIYNQGPNPQVIARKSPIPIYTVLIGDSTAPKDIAVRRIQTNQITYVKKQLPMEIVIWHNGYDGKRAVLTVSREGRQVARRIITLGQSSFEQKEIVDIVPSQPGDFNYTIRVEPLAGEITDRNNKQVVRVRVLKSKMKVLVLSGSPNFDRHFLSFVAKQLKDYQVTFLTEKTTGQYYEAPFQSVRLDSQDLLIFHGFPTGISDPAQVRRIMQRIEQQKIPVLWFISKFTNYQQIKSYQSLLPFRVTGRLTPLENRIVTLTAGGRFHPITELDENESANELLWKELPPIEVFPQLKMPEGSQVLLAVYQNGEVARDGKNLPVCYTYRRGELKQLVFNGANFGNWHFQLQEDPSREQMFTQFMDRAMRWLVNRDDIHQVQIQPIRRIYNVGEPVQFSGQVYDEFYQPIYDATVTITIEGPEAFLASDEMIAEGNGFYRQSFSGLSEGEYRYRVVAERNGQTIGVRNGKFTVNPFFLEYQQIPANYSLLRQLAQESGGRAYSPGQLVSAFPPAKMESRLRYTSSEYFLWHQMYWLFILIGLMGIEWFFRKRWGLL